MHQLQKWGLCVHVTFITWTSYFMFGQFCIEMFSFHKGNYVLDSDSLLAVEQPQFDVILCLSITKWLHLNWGDAGLKQAFRRMYLQLRTGGHLILEPQAWESYRKKKNLTVSCASISR